MVLVQTLTCIKRQIEAAADKYEESTLPPFFKALADYVEEGNSQFDCPGHQGGQFYCKHPAGRAFYDSTAKTCSVLTFVMRTLHWATF